MTLAFDYKYQNEEQLGSWLGEIYSSVGKPEKKLLDAEMDDGFQSLRSLPPCEIYHLISYRHLLG